MILQIKQLISQMSNGLPQLLPNTNRDAKDKQKKNKKTSPQLNYKGITLKEYFRICQESRPNNTLKQIKQESRASSGSSVPQTPNFNQQDQHREVRGKFKTEAFEMNNENNFKVNMLKCGESKGNVHSVQKGQKGTYKPMKKKEDRKKIFTKIHYTKEQYEIINRSTLNSFYHFEENKKKMLKKLELEKNRANDLKLSDAFFITKYGSKFKVDCKAVNQE